MFHKRSSLGGRKVSPPQPTCMTAEQKSTYLDNLRNNRPGRPTGSRPPPFPTRNHASSTARVSLTRSDSAPTISSSTDEAQQNESRSEDVAATLPKSVSFSSTCSVKGRPLAQPPTSDRPVLRGRKVSPTATVQIPRPLDDAVYYESASRRLEKEEAHNLREALELIDHKDEERRIYEAAQSEAADLVWKHRNTKAAEDEKTAAYRNPDLKLKEKTQSGERRQVSGSRKVSFPTSESKIYEEPGQTEGVSPPSVEASGTGMPLRVKSGNTLPWLRKKTFDKPETDPIPDRTKFDRFEIHRNPPTQSRNAEYTANNPPSVPTIDVIEEVDTPKSSSGTLEIRSEEIRAATSMRRKDRSPNLPTPTAVSDQLGRPIVSFNPSWRPPSDSPRASPDIDRPTMKLTESSPMAKSEEKPLPRLTSTESDVAVSAPTIPTVNNQQEKPSARPPPAIPEMTVSAPAVPAIHFPESGPEIPSTSLQPDDTKEHARPLPNHSATEPLKGAAPHKTPSNRLPWLHRHSMPTVSCSSCALPISGRIVTASGSNTSSLKARFHPECFTCHHCSSPLECVSFYPEPEEKRLARVESLGIEPGSPEAANDPLRFYCHLDFHEFFSPRCRSCKTPIEGEVIVAAGAEWHVGHFFCAECGDPFDSTTPFVEHDNYAYCVSCHTKRTSARCRECKQQILDELTVEALGGKYHEHCFVCFECGGGFGEEGRFFIRDVDVKPTEKEMRKGILRKVEEKAVCGPCEERRLKA
ncbi:uncharacterized protein Z518_11045 [Rhinocladiella mackenziei CBS 650.93]|uniref:LIM zinc-binding domain-containing protein n=1 Tax=Rhinocladiella mackenziei CBS 650.93 TaxID=1442369 RepID=A0A0D2GMP7_9EURO|nr:uncharacterized protein Z518_11045 [Rhinocladiella mackenziei CBS 650.93]KIW99632.1 hypothetical protein Z518_11045 [Rhinocladiella mackenziei CBS 650.93]